MPRGGWMTVTNVISPMMVCMDRFVIGAMISVTAVAYYATPSEVVSKLSIIPAALSGVIFPAFATSYTRDHNKTLQIFIRSTKYTGLALFPAALLITSFAHEGLLLWLGKEFAVHSTSIMQILVLGVFCNCLATVFFTYVQGISRPDLTAKLHMIELPLYLAFLWWAIHSYGIIGAAIAWSARVILDGALLLWFSDHFLCDNKMVLKRIGGVTCLALAAMALPMVTSWLWLRFLLFLVVVCGYIYVAFRLLDDGEHAYLRALLPR